MMEEKEILQIVESTQNMTKVMLSELQNQINQLRAKISSFERKIGEQKDGK